MRKKSLAIILLCLMITALFSGCTEQLSLTGTGKSDIKYDIKDEIAIVMEAPNLSTITEITIPDEYEGYPVKEIADFSVVNLENVAVIRIGKNVEKIGEWAFTNNQKLTAFEVDEENKYFCDVDGVLYTKDKKTLVSYPLAKGVKTIESENENGEKVEKEVIEYTIPDSVEVIRTKAFYKCSKITDIKFGASVKVIEEKAFFRCSEIKAISLPETVEFIGKDAFAYCWLVKEINIPASVKEIGDYAFYSCTEMKKVSVQNKESEMILGKKWYPTLNGQNMDIEIVWAD